MTNGNLIAVLFMKDRLNTFSKDRMNAIKREAGIVAALALIAFGMYNAVYSFNTKLYLIIMALGGLLLFVMTFFTGPDWEDRTHVSKLFRLAGIILTCAVLSLTIGMALFLANPLGNDEGVAIADYGNRQYIWGSVIPGNGIVSKIDNMDIAGEPPVYVSRLRFERAITGEVFKNSQKAIDTYTYTHGIQGEYDSILYNDEPFVIPYLVEGSDKAVIIIPGGGYAIRSNEGADDEGKDIALALNEAGYNAFVVWYRANPYPYPAAEMDVQRAIRWVKAYAKSYGISGKKVSLLGFGAGGNLVAEHLNQIRGTTITPEGYTGDSIDGRKDGVACAAMIYSFMNYRYNVPLLLAHYDADTVKSEIGRTELLETTDMAKNFNSAKIKQFVSYGSKDALISPQSSKDYITAAQEAGCDITVHIAKGAGHYYGQEYYLEDYLAWLDSCLGSIE